MKIGFHGPFKCLMCTGNEENVDHLFVTCPFSNECYSFFKKKLNWSGPLPGTLQGVFDCWPILSKTSVWSGLWYAIPTHIVWHTWYKRNARIFTDKQSSVFTIINGIEISICEHINCKIGESKCIMYSS